MPERFARTAPPLIRMGEMRVTADGDKMHTLLGSCVGLALFDRRQQIGGLAHILLPESRGSGGNPAKFVDSAVPALMEAMRQIASQELRLIAKLAGGASMFAATGPERIGTQNVTACEVLLKELRIPLVARHCGGEKGRRMAFDTQSGKVVIEIAGQDPVEL